MRAKNSGRDVFTCVALAVLVTPAIFLRPIAKTKWVMNLDQCYLLRLILILQGPVLLRPIQMQQTYGHAFQIRVLNRATSVVNMNTFV